MRVRPGVQLDAIGVAIRRARNRRGIRIGKETHAYPILMQAMRDLMQKFVMREKIPTLVGGQRVRRIGHQRRLRRFHLAHEV